MKVGNINEKYHLEIFFFIILLLLWTILLSVNKMERTTHMIVNGELAPLNVNAKILNTYSVIL